MAPPRTKTPRRDSGWITRSRSKMLVVLAATSVCLYLAFLLAWPFMPALVWSVTAAVVTRPLIHWLEARIESPTWRASLAVGIVAILLFAPVIGLVGYAAVQISGYMQNWQPTEYLTTWQAAIADREVLSQTWERVSTNLDLTRVIEQFTRQVRGVATTVATGTVYTLVQTLLSLFILFYLYRDESRVLGAVRQLSPLTDGETNRLMQRLGDTIHATIYGTVVVAIIQGILGGVIFWLLGLPAPALWGIVMAFMSMIPYLGSFVVWVPAAIYFAANGHWVKALLLAGWGTIVIGLIDNLLYPILVGNRLRQHTVIAFVAIVGGLAVFGASGIVLGPLVASLTFFLLEVWRRRTAAGRPAETA